MDNIDIWFNICNYIESLELYKLRNRISSKHDKITEQVLLNQVTILNSDEHFFQIFDWTEYNIQLTNLKDNINAFETDGSYILELFGNGFMRSIDIALVENRPFIRLIPDTISLQTIIYIPYNCYLINPMGINHDDRGTKKHKLEFKDFHSTWEIIKGFSHSL